MKYAEDCNYWKTSRTSADQWLDKTCKLIKSFNGKLLSNAFGNDATTNAAAYMVRFSIDGETFQIVWPVMKSKKGDIQSANRQAATMMYHDVKAKCVSAQVLGFRTAFFTWLEIEGKPMFRLSQNDLLQHSRQLQITSQTD